MSCSSQLRTLFLGSTSSVVTPAPSTNGMTKQNGQMDRLGKERNLQENIHYYFKTQIFEYSNAIMLNK